MVKTVSTAEARANLGDVLNGVYYTHEPVAVQKKGKTVAFIVSPDEYARYMREREAQAWTAIEQVQGDNADEDPDIILADVTAAVEEVRQVRHEQPPR